MEFSDLKAYGAAIENIEIYDKTNLERIQHLGGAQLVNAPVIA